MHNNPKYDFWQSPIYMLCDRYPFFIPICIYFRPIFIYLQDSMLALPHDQQKQLLVELLEKYQSLVTPMVEKYSVSFF